MINRDPSRFLQIGFLTLLFLCVLQVGYWVTENLFYTSNVQDEIEALAADETRDLEALSDLSAASEGRVNRYLWEGAFFLVVLVGGMAVLTRTLRHDAELRRRQQNFLAAVSHEFKSPLASVRLSAETLVMRAEAPDAQRLGKRILEDCERLLRMIDNLLDTTRIEEGRHVLTIEETELATAIATVVDSFEERAAEHSIRIRQDAPESCTLSIDSSALDTILRNLVDNALKACIAGDGHNIEVRVDQTSSQTVLRVIDDGLGFEPENAKLMFEKFHRLGDELRRQTPGTGLGLYLVRQLANLFGASLSATSKGVGRGAEFELSWPRGDTT